jgi:cullin-5
VPESKCPELLANYCDLLLRKTPLSKRLTPEETDNRLKDVVIVSLSINHYCAYLFQRLVLKYVQNKDVFMKFHKTHLSRRLILELSADQEKEEIMINRLRVCF